MAAGQGISSRRFYADLHVHSKYSRATSREADIEHLAAWARRKGIAVVGTGDFTHPAWFTEIREKLVPAEPGLFRLRDELDREVARTLPASCRGAVRFLLQVEISTIYKKGERTRKIHHLAYAPDFETAERLNRALGRIGNLASDGRPILGLDSRHLLEIVLESGKGSFLVPAHAWTPWFAVLGSNSGFDAVADCYGDLAEHVFALETGLSSDPPMNWRVSALDRYRLVSNSDAHSPPMLGREACVFETELDYFAMRRALETGDGYGGTVEFFPEEGKYHLDGHRKCGVRLEPAETRARDGTCPACGKPVTVGVMHRVETLADRASGSRPDGASPFRSLVPLSEILGEILRVGSKSESVRRRVEELVEKLGPELGILEEQPPEEIGRAAGPLLEEAVRRLRRSEVVREAGYDGEYGVIRVFDPRELDARNAIGSLFPTAREVDRRAVRPRPDSFAKETPSSVPAERKLEPSLDRASEILAELDPDQREAASILEGPLLIVAGPGTGKTRTLTHRLAHLVAERSVPPEDCLALTFSRRAAEEMQERLSSLLPAESKRLVVTTFHGFGLSILREEWSRLGLRQEARVASEAERIELARTLGANGEREARRLLSEISAKKRQRAVEASSGSEASELLDRYEAALRERQLLDWDDLLVLPLHLLESSPELADRYRKLHRWISIDEYQDVDELQYRLVRLLAPPGGNLCAIGDPDQAIYGFRGADVGFFLRFREDYPSARVVHLTRNYRSSATIVSGALQAIAPATLVTGRVLEATSVEEAPERIAIHAAPTERAEAEFVVHTIEELLGGTSYFSIDSGRAEGEASEALSFGDFAVLYRTEALAEPLEEALRRAGMPFQRRTHRRLLDRSAVEAIVRMLRDSPSDGEKSPSEAIRRAAGALESSTAEATREIQEARELLQPIAERCDHLQRFFEEVSVASEPDTLDPRAERISLLTLHAAKGLEFPVVFIVGCEDGILPLRFGAATDLAEERRLLFVGMTRARSRLILSHARQRVFHGQERERAPSPFLHDIEEALLERREAARRRSSAAVPTKQLRLF